MSPHRSIRLMLAAMAASGCVAVAGCANAPPSAMDHSPSPRGSASVDTPAWILTAGSVPRLEAAGLPFATLNTVFNNPDTLLLEGKGLIDRLLPRASPTMDFTSETGLADAFAAGNVPATVRWVLLDLEDWPLTPPNEQTDPIGALRTAVAIAHAHHKLVMFTPAADLLTVIAPRTPAPERLSTFERLIVRPGSQLADGFEVQSQGTEGSPDAVSFVTAAVNAARKARPGGVILAGLSTNPDGRKVTAGQMMVVYDAARHAGATGFWLNIPEAGPSCPRCGTPQTSVGIAFLHRLNPTDS